MRTIGTTALRTARRRAATIGITIAGAGALLLGVGVATSPMALADAHTQTVLLNNDEADVKENCPDTEFDYWHFIIAPNSEVHSFVSITLKLGPDAEDTFVFGADDIIPNGDQGDNVWVAVPAGYELDDIIKEGSSAQITPPTGSPMFVLSHLCDGTVTTTTTTSTTSTTSTTAAPTTTTTVAPTTTVAATTTTGAPTTTVAATTTTAGPTTTAAATTTTVGAIPPVVTLDVSSGGPAPTPAPGVQLPSTGGTTNSTALLGALLLVGGSILIITSRRRSAS